MANVIKTKFPKVLFFIGDFSPTDNEMNAAQEIGPGVVFRNANFVPANPAPGQIEQCDAIYALDEARLPKPYSAKFPVWEPRQGRLPFNGADASKFDHDGDGKPGGSKPKATAPAAPAAAPQGGTEAPAVLGQPAAPATPATAPENGAAAPATTPAPAAKPGAGKGWTKNG